MIKIKKKKERKKRLPSAMVPVSHIHITWQFMVHFVVKLSKAKILLTFKPLVSKHIPPRETFPKHLRPPALTPFSPS